MAVVEVIRLCGLEASVKSVLIPLMPSVLYVLSKRVIQFRLEQPVTDKDLLL